MTDHPIAQAAPTAETPLLIKLANLSLLILFPIAWFAPLMRAGLLPQGQSIPVVGIWRNCCSRETRLAVAALKRLDFADLQFRNRP